MYKIKTKNLLLGENQLMTPDQKEQLQTGPSALVENMNPKAVINRLCSYQVLTLREAEEVSSAGRTSDQKEKLLDCLRRKPDTALKYVGMHFDEVDIFIWSNR